MKSDDFGIIIRVHFRWWAFCQIALYSVLSVSVSLWVTWMCECVNVHCFITICYNPWTNWHRLSVSWLFFLLQLGMKARPRNLYLITIASVGGAHLCDDGECSGSGDGGEWGGRSEDFIKNWAAGRQQRNQLVKRYQFIPNPSDLRIHVLISLVSLVTKISRYTESYLKRGTLTFLIFS